MYKSIMMGAAILLLSSSGLAIASDYQPFGISPGVAPSTYGGNEEKFGQSINPPKPHPDFDYFGIQSTKETGICLIRAFTKATNVDKTGALIKERFNIIKEQLDSKYGRAEISEPYYFLDAGEEWSNQIVKGDRYYRSAWHPDDNDQIGPKLEQILLEVSFIKNGGKTYIQLDYEYSNYVTCRSINENKRKKEIEDKLKSKSSNL